MKTINEARYRQLFDASNWAAMAWLSAPSLETKVALEKAQQAVKDYLMSPMPETEEENHVQ